MVVSNIHWGKIGNKIKAAMSVFSEKYHWHGKKTEPATEAYVWGGCKIWRRGEKSEQGKSSLTFDWELLCQYLLTQKGLLFSFLLLQSNIAKTKISFLLSKKSSKGLSLISFCQLLQKLNMASKEHKPQNVFWTVTIVPNIRRLEVDIPKKRIIINNQIKARATSVKMVT